ncbi:MAG TPA: metallophosphoesterase [Symbiobacteriaceae bacterium]
MGLFVILPLILAVYGAVNYYVGLRGWQWLTALTAGAVPCPLYWTLFWLLALSFPLARLTADQLPLLVSDWLVRISSYWMAFFVCALLVLPLFDLLRLMARWSGLLPAGLVAGPKLARLSGLVVCALVVGLFLYGTWRARTPVVTEYDLTIPKQAPGYRELNVVLVSDTHLGAIIGNRRIRQLVETVNRLQPDLVLLAGDIVDDSFRPFVAYDMPAELSRLRAPLGVYSVLGNHDAGSENLAEFRAQMERAGIRLLVDEWVKVDDSFYVVGRSDGSWRRYSGRKEIPLTQILAGVDPSLPILLMDHKPDRLEEAVASGVDLQVSGHTHRGQIFPGNLITRRIFEVDAGYLQKGKTHFIVSVGYGTWGPPIRIGNRPEVVRIHITFSG